MSNPPTRQEVISLLTLVQGSQSQLLELHTAHTAALDAIAQAQASIAAIGEPALNDDDGINRLAGAEKKLSLATTAAADLAAKIDTACRSAVPVLDTGGQIVRRLLSLALAEKVNAVATKIRGSCSSDDEAKSLAGQTNNARGWAGQLAAYGDLYRQPDPYTAPAFLAALARIEAPCVESLGNQPALGQFFN